MAGTVADCFEKSADLIEEMAGVRLSEATVKRTANAGRRLAEPCGRCDLGPKGDGPRTRITRASGVRTWNSTSPEYGNRLPAAAAEGRMAYVGWSATRARSGPGPMRSPAPCSRYASRDSIPGEIAPLIRPPAGRVSMDRADRWIGLSDGGNGLEGRLQENFPRIEPLILDFFHPAEKLAALARLLHPKDEDRAESKHDSGVACSKTKGAHAGGRAQRVGVAAASGIAQGGRGVVGYEANAQRMEYPEYLARDWSIGGGAVESACKTVVGQRLKAGRMRWSRTEPTPSAISALISEREGPVGGLLGGRSLPRLNT